MYLLQDVYDLNKYKITQVVTEAFNLKKEDKQFNNLVYKLWINYRQLKGKLRYKLNVA